MPATKPSVTDAVVDLMKKRDAKIARQSKPKPKKSAATPVRNASGRFKRSR
jgi:hypothetical protein